MKSFATLALLIALISIPVRFAAAQAGADGQSFDKIEIFEPVGDSVRESDVRVNFGGDAMEIVSRKSGTAIKRFDYKEIRSAEYSYTKSPRWKTALDSVPRVFFSRRYSSLRCPSAFRNIAAIG